MPTRIWIDGVIGGADAAVPVLDGGFLFGDSVFETVRAGPGGSIDLDAHLERLEAAARALAIAAPPRDRLTDAIAATVAAAAEPDLRVRVIVTRGRSDADAPAPVVIVTAQPCAPLAPAPAPVRLAIVDRPLSDPRTLDPSLKTGAYLPNLLALRAARAAGADDALRLTAGGLVAEASSSNLFAVIGGALVTPAARLGFRAGVTRARVIALCADAGVPVAEVALVPAELTAATELFLTSSIKGVVPVGRVVMGDRTVVDGAPAPGPRTEKITEAYAVFATQVATRGAG